MVIRSPSSTKAIGPAPGTGPEAAEGDAVWIHYVGAAQSTGEVFDASWDRGPGADRWVG